jgi:excisionase family DNA binding protein
LTIKQVAERLNVGLGTAYALCARRQLEHVRVGAGRGTLRVSEEALERFIEGATVRLEGPAAPKPRTPAPARPVIRLTNLSLS